MDIYKEITELVGQAAKEAGVNEPDILLDHPVDLAMGDITTNVAMVYAKELGEKPTDLALKIVGNIKPHQYVQEVKVAGPGFINIYLSPEFFNDSLKNILDQRESFGRSELLDGKKVMVEYTDPNPFKELHIGHLMANTIGEALSRIVESQGAEVKRVCYQGDVGLHVAKTIWAVMKKGFNAESVSELGQAYAYGATEYEKSEEAKQEINELNKKIYERADDEVNKIYQIGRQASLDYFETIYKKLGTKFDDYFYESEVGQFGKQIVEENTGKVFEESEGAVVYKGEQDGLHTRVFINSQGLPTYEAKELGLAKVKYDKFAYDQSIVVTGNEIVEYFKVLLSALSKIYPELASRTEHIAHGMLRLPTGKMSSRTGDVIPAEQLIDEVKEKVAEKMADREIGNKEEVVEAVAIGALKYSILKQDIGKDIIFDFDKSLSFEGNSGPYLQYAYVRTQSVLKKAGEQDAEFERDSKIYDIERLLYRFPQIASRAYSEKAPQLIATYLHNLAGQFSSLYAEEKFIGGENQTLLIALTDAVGLTLKNGLNLLGIKAPEEM